LDGFWINTLFFIAKRVYHSKFEIAKKDSLLTEVLKETLKEIQNAPQN
jgi:hypothetical protein